MLPSESISVPQEAGAWGGAPLKKPRPVRAKLTSSAECARLLASLIRRTLAGTMKSEDLGRYSNALLTLSRLLEGGEFEKRLSALEENYSK